MSEQLILAILTSLPAIILAVVALVKAFRSDAKATEANVAAAVASRKADSAITEMRKF